MVAATSNPPSSRRAGRLRVGTSGYQYDHWRGVLYPDDLPRDAWFRRYTEVFDTVEINNTFYQLPTADTVGRWRERTPPGFLYAVKFSRYGSHLKKLDDPQDTIGPFCERLAPLAPHLGPVLVQLPPNWRVNARRLDDFLAAAPADWRWAVEVRDRSWLCADVYAVLREHHAALVIHDRLAGHPVHVTSDLVYLRYHGHDYGGGYSPQALSGQARRVRRLLADHRDVFAFFNNDRGGHAVPNALDLRRFARSG